MQLARAVGLGRARRAGERVPLALVLGACGVLLVVTLTLGVGAGAVALSPATGLARHRRAGHRPAG
jgi:hypothetical protein